MHLLTLFRLFLLELRQLGPEVWKTFFASWGVVLGLFAIDWVFVEHLTVTLRLVTAVVALIGAVASTIWVFRRMRRLDRSKGTG
jgi:Flp pilus assembly protein TadB